MKTTRHWLHLLLCVLTSGLWLPVYVILLATTEMYNRGYKVGKAEGRREIANDPEWMRVTEFSKSGTYTPEPGSGHVTIIARGAAGGGGCRAASVMSASGAQAATFTTAGGGAGSGKFDFERSPAKSRVDRFAELADRNRTVGLDAEERREYFQLRAELSR